MDMKPRKKQAVMVWIHGGAYYAGAGNMNLYGPDHIVEKEVVLVTLNYRLSALGKPFIPFQHSDLLTYTLFIAK
jgi:carboxylesterase type B